MRVHYLELYSSVPSSLNLDEGEVTRGNIITILLLRPSRAEENTVSLADIIHNLNRILLSMEYFAKNMVIITENIESYTCPKNDVLCGFVSKACCVRLLLGNKTALYKSILFGELDHKQEKLKNNPYKLVRDAQSYKVVADFLSLNACEEATKEASAHIPKCYNA